VAANLAREIPAFFPGNFEEENFEENWHKFDNNAGTFRHLFYIPLPVRIMSKGQ